MLSLTRREKFAALAARNAVPAMYHYREYVLAGGLNSYGIDFADSYRQAGVYTRRHGVMNLFTQPFVPQTVRKQVGPFGAKPRPLFAGPPKSARTGPIR